MMNSTCNNVIKVWVLSQSNCKENEKKKKLKDQYNFRLVIHNILTNQQFPIFLLAKNFFISFSLTDRNNHLHNGEDRNSIAYFDNYL